MMCYLKINIQKSLELIQKTAAMSQKKEGGIKKEKRLIIGKSTHPRE